MDTRITYNKQKLRELVLYLAQRSDSDRYFGATKLNKLLFCIDFESYLRTGAPVTGCRYQKLKFGPAPRPLLPVLQELEEERACVTAAGGHLARQKRVIATREPDLDLFTSAEIALVDEVISHCWNHTGTMLSDWSHEHVGWELAEMGEDIPYQTALVADPRPLTPAEIEYGRTLDHGAAL